MKLDSWVAAISLAVLLSVSPAGASTIDVGNGSPILGNSWSWPGFATTNVVDKIEAFIVSGNADLETPGILVSTPTGWSSTLVNPDYALATGASSSFTIWSAYFTGVASSESFKLDFLFWDANAFLGGVYYDWIGSDWSPHTWNYFPITDPSGFNRTPVPEPSTMLLLGSGLIGLAGYGRKKLFKK